MRFLRDSDRAKIHFRVPQVSTVSERAKQMILKVWPDDIRFIFDGWTENSVHYVAIVVNSSGIVVKVTYVPAWFQNWIQIGEFWGRY